MQGNQPLTHENFAATQATVSKVFSVLYTIDITTLSIDQRKDHQQALAAAHLALIQSENARFEQLNQEARVALADLGEAIGEIDAQLHALQGTAQKIEVLAKAAKVFQAFAGVLG